MPQGEGPYSAAWSRYRAWSHAFWAVFVLYLPALAFVGRVLGWTGEGNAIFLAAFVWMIAFAGQHNPFARRCMHCGLPKWAAVDPGPPPPGEARP